MPWWEHAHKGRIKGKVVKDLGEFVHIRLDKDAPIVESGTCNWQPGEIIVCRKSFLRRLNANKERRP